MAACQVCAYLLDHALLRAGEVERELFVQGVEGVTDLGHADADFAAAAYVFLFQEGKLKEEQFLELQAV